MTGYYLVCALRPPGLVELGADTLVAPGKPGSYIAPGGGGDPRLFLRGSPFPGPVMLARRTHKGTWERTRLTPADMPVSGMLLLIAGGLPLPSGGHRVEVEAEGPAGVIARVDGVGALLEVGEGFHFRFDPYRRAVDVGVTW